MTKLLIGMVHLPPLPGSPRASLSMDAVVERAVEDAQRLAAAGFDGVLVENFGDAPFFGECVEPVTVAAMARAVTAVRLAVPRVRLGVNVLRNDARAALSIAAVCGAEFVRINVHVGATATDQGVLEGRAAETLRLRRALDVPVQIWADVHVKHGHSLAHAEIGREAEDAVRRGLADALVVSGAGTGWDTSLDDVREVARLELGVPILIGSGATAQSISLFLREADGVIVGSSIKEAGDAAARVDPERSRRFVEAARNPTTAV